MAIETTQDALHLAREAVDGWARYARPKREHDEIARLRRSIDLLEASSSRAQVSREAARCINCGGTEMDASLMRRIEDGNIGPFCSECWAYVPQPAAGPTEAQALEPICGCGTPLVCPDIGCDSNKPTEAQATRAQEGNTHGD